MRGRRAPHLVAEGDELSLHFERSQVQSRMHRAEPNRLVLDYTRTMMGFLLLHPTPARIVMIGLGGGSLAKCCRCELPEADFTAVELSADVIALRDVFGIPPDGPRFRVVCGDGAAYVGTGVGLAPLWDVLLVDGFDGGGQPSSLCSAAFYDACASRLRDGGVLVVNLNADATGYGSYARRIRDAFDGNLVVVETEDRQNKIVFARKGGPVPSLDVLLDRAGALGAARFPISLAETARAMDGARSGGKGGRR
ncbi:MAG: transferase [Pseudomonadota bacterium]|nr:transferase [Pseudomonadota bacterium]